ncbi:hypothetical protein XSR1_160082 [Xenorhabdus szentirmaii DSM 16338]|uniref:Transposase n=1 Tax=Xenorhabdus szentirmaii DSM 16338 TaxID=1427518 RepID=W1ITP9_9GAMM|nr:hypothetical protein XSR1_160082 [Xenorhabdus szentirmaii DSM 16338]
MPDNHTHLTQKKINNTYKPKTCPFCNYYGIVRYPKEKSWSCNQCGRMWKNFQLTVVSIP